MDAGIVIAAIGFAGSAVTYLVGRKQRAADAQDIAARAANAVQDTYQELIADLRAQAQISREEAMSAKQSAREAQQQADISAHEAWKAGQQLVVMFRFLAELRPLIAAHIPAAEPFLERLDDLTAAAYKSQPK